MVRGEPDPREGPLEWSGEERRGRQRSKKHEGAAGWADPRLPCRAGHVKDIGLFLTAMGALKNKQ